MKKIESHPDVPLIKHLKEVADGCRIVISKRLLNCAIPKECLSDIGFIMGCVHDITKSTENFQIYLSSRGKVVIKPKHHALMSAYVAKEAVSRFLNEKWFKKLPEDLFDILPYLAFTAVKRHHGNLKDFSDELCVSENNKRDLGIQVNNFCEPEAGNILKELFKEVNLDFDWEQFKSYMRSGVYDQEYSFFALDLELKLKNLPPDRPILYFYIHQLLFSALLFSDKSDVILDHRRPELPDLNFGIIEGFRKKKGFDKPESTIDKYKNRAYQEGLQFLEEQFDFQQHLYSVTLPTGLGKTLTSLAIAMKMRQLLKNPVSRIIITIPFTSVIEQNHQVFYDVLGEPSSEILLKHHHLSEPSYKAEDDTILENHESKFLIETWQSQVVVTTFVQLLECIFTNNKSKLLKFPNLTNSIIILDEVQNIKYELWEAVRHVFKLLGERLNCYFILMSATQPLIFTPSKEITELIPRYRDYFQLFNRTKLVNRTKTSIKFEDFCIEIKHYHEKNPEKNILIILNTKEITKKCFERLCEEIPEEKANLYFLSTYITPYERKIIIKRIKEKENKIPNIIISTQLIEAGVDLSVHTVFRALAPLDSIIQAAGRANRYSELGDWVSEIFLYEIEELKKSSSLVYGQELLQKTRQVLDQIDIVEERDYLGLIDAYFKKVRVQSDNIDSKLLKHICQLDFEKVGEFSFIEERKTESIFIQLNQQAKRLWETYISIASNQDLRSWEKKAAFSKIKAEFYDFVINVGVPWNGQSIQFDSEQEHFFYLSRLEKPSICYQYDYKGAGGDFRLNQGYIPNQQHTISV